MSDFVKTSEQYGDGIELVEYKGSWFLHAAREGKDGKVYEDWAYPQGPNKSVKDKAVPVKVKLGESKTAALNTLKMLIMDLGGAEPEPGGDEFDDIPF